MALGWLAGRMVYSVCRRTFRKYDFRLICKLPASLRNSGPVPSGLRASSHLEISRSQRSELKHSLQRAVSVPVDGRICQKARLCHRAKREQSVHHLGLKLGQHLLNRRAELASRESLRAGGIDALRRKARGMIASGAILFSGMTVTTTRAPQTSNASRSVDVSCSYVMPHTRLYSSELRSSSS